MADKTILYISIGALAIALLIVGLVTTPSTIASTIDTGTDRPPILINNGGNSNSTISNTNIPCYYLVFASGTSIKAKNCSTGSIDFSSTDAYTTINNAVRTMNNSLQGGVIHISAGYYNISNTIQMASGITIEGEGSCSFTNSCSTHLRLSDNINKDMFQYNSTKYGNAMFMTWRNLFIDGNRAHNTSNGTSSGIYLIGTKVFDPAIQNIYIDGFNNHCFRQSSGAWNTHIFESVFEHCSLDGLFIDGGSATDVSIIQSKFLSNNQYGVELGSSANGGITAMRFTDNYIASNTKFNMVTWNLQQAIYTSNTFQDSNGFPNTGDNLAIENNCSNSIVANNVFIGAGHTRHAILIANANCANALITSNSIAGSYTSTIVSDSGTTTKFRDNIGYITENSGTATVTNPATTVVVTHGLSFTPTIAQITIQPQATWGLCANWWVSNPTSTQFTINCSATPAVSLAFSWSAEKIP